MDRRRFLAVGGVATLAGCLGDGGTGVGYGEGSGGSGDDGSGGTASGESGQTIDDHPAAQAIDAQPFQGPPPREATGVVVAFEDPSCRTCERFEREVVPQLRSQYVEPGTVSLVFRGYPVVYSWGEPATRALEAVFDHDADAHWTLVDHYFQNQGDFLGSDDAGVYDQTESFLASETDFDATAVLDAARAGDYDTAVQTDLDAGMAAGAGQTTPYLYFFRDGEFRTGSAGYTPMTTIETALGL